MTLAWWWLSSLRMTVGVGIDARDIVRDGAPIVRRFIGQPSRNLGAWMRRQGGFRAVRLSDLGQETQAC